MATSLLIPNLHNSAVYKNAFSPVEGIQCMDDLHQLLELYKLQMNYSDSNQVCSGGLQQFLNKNLSEEMSTFFLLPVGIFKLL